MGQATLKLLDLAMSTENLIASYGEDIEATTRAITKEQASINSFGLDVPVDTEWVDSLVEQNSQRALAVMYMSSIMNDIAEVMPLIRILDEVNNGNISDAIFNKRYEYQVFGNDLA